MRSKIFYAIFFTSLLMILCSAILLFVISQALSFEREYEHLEDFTHDLAAKLNVNPDIDLRLLDGSSYRITIVSQKGHVISDNRTDASMMQYHGDREEIVNALKYGRFKTYRYSNTLDSRHLYYAIVLSDGNVLRVSVSSSTIFSHLAAAVITILILAALLAIISYVGAKRLTYRIMGPLNSIDFQDPIIDVPYPEIRPLISRIYAQKKQINEQVDEIKKQHNEFFVITNSMKEGLIILNKNGKIISINKSALKFYATKEEFIGRSLLSLDRSEHMRSFFEHRDTVIPKSIEITLNNRDLKYYFNEIVVNGELLGYAILIINITAQNLAQKHRQEFTANVSHELKTPLQSIIGYAELLENKIAKPEDVSSFGEKIKRQGQNLLHLIEDLLFLSALDEGKANFQTEVFLLNDLAREVLETLDMQIKEKNITATVRGDDIYINGIYRLFYELLYNLCDNGIKYNKDGGELQVILDQDERHFVIRVSDTGIGIEKEFQERVFERFFRVEKNIATIKGTGLGLSIVKRITLYYKGKVKLKSFDGEGSVFSVIFPNKNLVAEKGIPSHETAEGTPGDS